jgi:CubicO group peptidase (beta-lactamase class C family)
MRPTTILLLLLLTSTSFSQSGPETPYEKEVDEQAQLIKKYFNTKQVDSLYALMAPSFKKMVTKEALEQGMITQLAPYGIITKYDFISSKNGVNKYKTKMLAGLELQTLVGIDSTGLVNTFAMQPYKDETAPKRKKLYTDNPLATKLDSIIDKAAKSYIMDSATFGLSVAVHWKGKDYFYNYGEADKQKDVKVTLETGFEIGSITKTFVGYLLAMAVAEKKVALNDPITKYLPDSVAKNPALQKIKIVHLANHTSGLPRLPVDLYNTPSFKQNDPYSHFNDAMLFNGLKQIKPTRAPDVQYEYSNYAMGILGTILGRVYNQSFESMVWNRIFTPMQLRNSTAGNKQVPNMSIGYNDKGSPTAYWNFQSLAAAGSIKSTPADLLNYGKATLSMMNSNKPEAALLKTPTYNKPPTIVTLGWQRNPTTESPAIFQHGGGTYGFRSQLSVCPEQGWAVVALANHGVDPGASGVALQITEQLKGVSKNL